MRSRGGPRGTKGGCKHGSGSGVARTHGRGKFFVFLNNDRVGNYHGCTDDAEGLDESGDDVYRAHRGRQSSKFWNMMESISANIVKCIGLEAVSQKLKHGQGCC